jgi:Holliday junction DNA helicase RuvA
VADKVPTERGRPVDLEIYAVLNMDGNSGRFSYYGFTNPIERQFFEALITVASIGPRSAARAFSQPMSAIARAIDRGDHAYLKTLPGIGQQKARDIVAKLQGKVAKFLLIQDAPSPPAEAIPDFASEALAVLLQLEYKRAEAEAMIRETLEAGPHIGDAEGLLAEMYRRKASKERP